VLLLLCCHCKKEIIKKNHNFTENIYKTDYGLSIKIPKEYKKINETSDGVLFSKGGNEDIAILLWTEDVPILKKFYTQTKEAIIFKLENQDAYLLTKKEKIGFGRYVNVRLEIFPEGKDIQITVLARIKEKDYEKIIATLSTIKIE